MDDLYKVGQRVSQDGASAAAAIDPAALEAAMQGNPELAELLAGGGNIEQYLQSYEQMLQEGLQPGGPKMGEVDEEGGITVRPDPGFVVKTRDQQSGTKVFLNIVSNEHVEAPHMKEFVELEGESGCRVPLSVGAAIEDFDKKNEPCVTYDVVANPTVVEECLGNAQFKDTVVQLVVSAVAQKYKVELDPRYKLPKVKYKGGAVQVQRLRKQRQSQIQEVGSGTPAPGGPPEAQGARAGPAQPDFCVYYARPGAPAIDGFSEKWGAQTEGTSDMVSAANICGSDLPCYRVNEFQENFRGTMKNRAERQKNEEAREERGAAPGEAEMREVLAGRTCVVQVRMPDLDPHVPALKQFGVEVSDECLRISFPMLPRSGRSAHVPLAIWWPKHFCAAQAEARWEPKSDSLTVSLPTDAPEEPAGAFDQALLDAVF